MAIVFSSKPTAKSFVAKLEKMVTKKERVKMMERNMTKI